MNSYHTFRYPRPRPNIVIEQTGGRQISPCYEETVWRITSFLRLKQETILGMYRLGIVGFGQEFSVRSQCDGKEPPAGHDTVECVEHDAQGNPLPGPAINLYSGKPYGTTNYPYFVYECISRCDSGD